MFIKEIFTEVINPETGEVFQVSNFKNNKLYGLFSVVSNKTVREKEKYLRRWFNKKKEIPSERIEKTNRGWFIDGYNVDDKSVDLWFSMVGLDRNFKPKKKWNSAKKHKK